MKWDISLFSCVLEKKYRMHPLSEGIFCWINKGHYFWYLFWHWSIGVFGKQRCFCEVTCETSCHSFSLVPQLQKCCGADERLFLDNTCFFFFTTQNEKQIALRLSDGNTVRLPTELEKQQQRLQQSRHPRNQHIIMVWASEVDWSMESAHQAG